MKRRPIFLVLATGLLTSLALSTPTQAGTVSYNSTFSLATGTASEFYVDFGLAPADQITAFTPATSTDLAGVSYTIDYVAGVTNELIITFTPASTGYLDGYTITAGGPRIGGGLGGLSVPEPSSMALLGVGLASFIAFRRFFRPTAVA